MDEPLSERELELIELIADDALRVASFERLARGWIQEIATLRAANDRLREELRRYVASRI